MSNKALCCQPLIHFLKYTQSFLFLTFLTSSAQAQIIPDATLPVNSTVRQQGNFSVIEGGTNAGTNLFHSFQQFSIPTNGAALFNNSLNIQNIFSRVTGTSISNIDGLIRANGTANLFLINPNGIIFGQNAFLNIGGSFLASTANRINFADGTEFAATNGQKTSLLTISVPIGLQLGSSPAQIVNRSIAAVAVEPNTSSPLIFGLQVQPGKTLALLGNDIVLENGFLTASGGKIELGSVRDGFVSLTQDPLGFGLKYQNISTYGDIQISGYSTVNASGIRGGDIQLQGRRITLTDQAKITSFTLGSLPGGNLTVNASDSVLLTGTGGLEQSLLNLISGTDSLFDQRNGLFTPSVGNGAGGNIIINTGSLIVHNGGLVLTSTFNAAPAGNIFVNATEKVDLNEAALLTGSKATGSGGNLSIKTPQLTITRALAATASFGTGRSGNLNVDASLVELTGSGSLSLVPNLNLTNVRIAPGLNTSGVFFADAGNLIINTDRLIVRDGAGIGATTAGTGRGGTLTINATELVELNGAETGLSVATNSAGAGGDLEINTRRLLTQNGGGADASTFGLGKGGTLVVKASELIELIGKNEVLMSRNGGLATRSTSGGEAGNLRIETERLIVRDRALVSVGAESLGGAGNLEIDADAIELNNQGIITGATTAGQGNISLQSARLILRHGSSITTNATGAETAGGNININTGILAALENSDISANSQKAQGGRVTINAQAIFGSQFRTREQLERLLNTSESALLVPARLPSSDITATGANPSLSGTVAINTPDLDPSAGVVKLPENPVDATRLIASTCRRDQQQSEFNITGRGGLPPNPYEAISEEATWIDLRPIADTQKISATEEPKTTTQDSTVSSVQFIEAQGWVINSKGQLELVAQVPAVSPHFPSFTQQQCPSN